jgi:hypothetical protein
MSILSKTIRLNDGTFIPRLAFGTGEHSALVTLNSCVVMLMRGLSYGILQEALHWSPSTST